MRKMSTGGVVMTKYSEEKIEKALRMQFREKNGEYYVKADSDKDCYEYKLTIGASGIPKCNCWWYTIEV